MDTKSLLIGIISFIAGGLLVSTAAVTFDKESLQNNATSSIVESLKDKRDDEFDEAFITEMIAHHESAVEIAKLSEDRAKHNEIKQLSQTTIDTQEKEIDQMKQWQTSWGYETSSNGQRH